MRRSALPAVSLSFLFCACLEAPPPPPPVDAGTDAGAPRFFVREVHVEDRLGRTWPKEAIPRAPRVVIELSDPPLPDEDPWAMLLRGAPDDDLAEDAARAPLRAANRERQFETTLDVMGSTVILTPHERLAPGEPITVLVASWASSEHGALEAPFLRSLVASTATDAGTRAIGSWPADGASGVPSAISELWVWLDGPVSLDGVQLRETAPRASMIPARVAEAPCGGLGWSGSCVILRPEIPLAPGVEHAIELGPEAVDPTGAPVGPWSARFRTAVGLDAGPPVFVAPTCAVDEVPLEVGCALVDDTSLTLRVITDEPCRMTLTVGARVEVALAPRGEATLRVQGLSPGAHLDAQLEVVDLAGHEAERAFALETPSDLAALSITEVRANPAGAEPRQEYVEVLNSGDVPLDLSGFALSDRPDALGDVVERAFVLGARERVLLVADRFDPDDPEDTPAVPPGVPLLRLGTSLASAGLTNAGEPLFLRDALGRRLSAAPAREVGSGRCLARLDGAPPRTADDAAFEVRACRPGRP